ncbi:hypothetical protein D1BOALGB6SA_5907 [Olavius sp. associated proteobacterium Delta 1]|nr:hypothetical protein D1BOALGB6SA_5907 [Olavius sp. associated proteobacterium Delta 1]
MKMSLINKFGRSFLAVCLLLALFSISVAQADAYCSSSGRNVGYEWIDSIRIGTFNNVSGANAGYADFTSQTVDLAYGTNSITLTPGFRYGSYIEFWRIWIDFNQDGIFDADELLFDQSSRTAVAGEIMVPDDALPGSTRMRISMKWAGAPPACGTFSYGEVEDYTVQLSEPTATLGKISALAAGNDPELVFAADQDNQALYVISTSTQWIVDTVALPDPQPSAMDYSPADDKLYIVSASSGRITIVDPSNSQITRLPFSDTQTGTDIAVAPLLRKIFVLSPNGYDAYLTIVDMDSGAVILQDTVGGSSIAVDENSRMIFTGDRGLSPATIEKYYLDNDNGTYSLQQVQTIQAGSNGRKINISPDGLHIVYPCGGGNGAGYSIYDYDSTDLNTVLGEWDVGTYPNNAAFSPDGTVLFGTNGSPYDNYLYVMDAAGYQQINKLDFPNADDYAVFTPNSDGTVVVGFSYDTYYDDDYSLYFFTDLAD